MTVKAEAVAAWIFSQPVLHHELKPANSLCEAMGGGKEGVEVQRLAGFDL